MAETFRLRIYFRNCPEKMIKFCKFIQHQFTESTGVVFCKVIQAVTQLDPPNVGLVTNQPFKGSRVNSPPQKGYQNTESHRGFLAKGGDFALCTAGFWHFAFHCFVLPGSFPLLGAKIKGQLGIITWVWPPHSNSGK